MSALHSGGHQFDAGVQLGAAALPAVHDEAGVTADLPQPHENGEHRHFVLRLCRLQLVPGVHHRCQIELALLLLQLNAVDVLGLGGQLFQHVGFHPAEEERPGQLVQPAGGSLVVLLHDGLFKPGAEALIRRQIARHQEREDAPQLSQPVFHRGARQCKPHPAVDLADSLVFLGGVVLDGLGLIQDAGVKRLPGVQLFIPPEQVVTGHHHIGAAPLFCQRGPVGGVAVHHQAV